MATRVKGGIFELSQQEDKDLKKDKKVIKEVKDPGFQSWTETTFYPESNRTVPRNYNNNTKR